MKLAKAIEGRGFESLWMPEHTHIPVPEDGGDVVPGPGAASCRSTTGNMSDRFVSLAAAAVTDRIKLGTSVCVVNPASPD
ncbi:MAG: LLM class flavin-dependent oxidoreductase [Dehalococcoidia bacterium]